MKKLVTMLLATLMCLILGAFVACSGTGDGAHDHTFSSEWSKEANSHYHACTHAGCTEKSDEQMHQWGTGSVVDGFMVYTCTVCEYSKNEVIPHIYDVDSSEWEAALSLDVNYFDNYVIETVNRIGQVERTQTVEFNNGKIKSSAQVDGGQTITYMYNEGARLYSVYKSGEDWRQGEIDVNSYNNARTLGISQMFNYSDFAFDGTKYTAASIQIPGAPMSYDDVNVYFEDRKVIKIEFSFTIEGQTSEAIINYTYGNASEIIIPEIKLDTEVTADEWRGGFLDLKGWFTYELEITENNETEFYTAKVIGGQRLEIDFGEDYNVYYQKEVYDYYKYTNVDGRWKKIKVEEQEFRQFENYVVYMFGSVLEFDQFEYDEEDCVYKFIGEIGEGFEGSGVTVTFLDNKIKNINVKMVNGEDVVEINCDYNLDESIVVEIPKLDTTVTAQEWVVAFSSDFRATENTEDYTEDYVGTGEIIKKGNNFRYELNDNVTYYESKDNRYFKYYFESVKGGYLREEVFYDEGWMNDFDIFSSLYSQFTYDATIEAYVLEQDGSIVRVYMLDDKVLKVEEEQYDDITLRRKTLHIFDYENVPEVVFPDYIDLNAVTATDWVGAFNIDAQNNYTMTWKETSGTEDITVYTKDGDVLRMVYGENAEYFARTDGAEYHFYMQDDEWKKKESQPENGWQAQTSAVIGMPVMIAFNEMEYDVDDCEYFAQTVTNVPAFKDITFKFFEGKIVFISISAANQDAKIEITIQYQGDQLELPEVYEPTVVTREQFAKAIDIPALVKGSNPQSFSFTYSEYDGDAQNPRYVRTVSYHNGTDIYIANEFADEPSRNSYYIWYRVPEEERVDTWNDPRILYFYKECSYGPDWTRQTHVYYPNQYEYELYENLRDAIVPGQNYYFISNDDYYELDVDFDIFTYDSVKGCYHADQVDYSYNVNLYFENGVLQRFTRESEPGQFVVKQVVEFNYNPAPIELPTEFI